jgi:thiosulfate/3-mercaptopyruvate sulfurtransferase
MRRLWAVSAVIVVCLALGVPAQAQEASSQGGVEIPAVYAHPEVLVDVDWLAAHLEDPSVRVVDARVEGPPYSAGHIPGAISVDIFDELCCPSDIMDAEPFAALMGSLGIGDDTTVVVYDTTSGLWGARVWWALRYYGHDQARLLDGGLGAWEARGLPLETDTPPPLEAAVFSTEVQPRWHVTMDEVRAAIDDPGVSIVDALPADSYASGHIPGALSLPAPDLLDATGATKGAEELAAMLLAAGLDPAQRVITYCGGGYYGAFAAAVLDLMGFEDVAMYDGALAEWTSDPSNPVERVP